MLLKNPSPCIQLADRLSFLRTLAASPEAAAELLAGLPPPFPEPKQWSFPLSDAPGINAWEEYMAAAREQGAFPVLQEKLVQLRFPVEKGISETEAYRAATRRGIFPGSTPADLPGLRDPAALSLSLQQTPAGRIPLLDTANREDFVYLVQALACKNEPRPVPPSQGAQLITGLANWDRIARLRRAWEMKQDPAAANPLGAPAMGAVPGLAACGGWNARWQELQQNKERYQDALIILSHGPYSGVAATSLGLDKATWLDLSCRIRLGHESAHYLCKRVLGAIRNSMHDELVADYYGLATAACGWRADWLRRFLGLEDFPVYREGGRLENYRGDPPLSEPAFVLLQQVLVRAIDSLDRCLLQLGEQATHKAGRLTMLLALAGLDLVELATAAGADQLEQRFTQVRSRVQEGV